MKIFCHFCMHILPNLLNTEEKKDGKENAEEKHIFSKSFKEFLKKKEIDMIHTF